MDQKEVHEAVKAVAKHQEKKVVSAQQAPIANKVQNLIEKKKRKDKKKAKKKALEQKCAKAGNYNPDDIEQVLKMSTAPDVDGNIFDKAELKPKGKYGKVAKKLMKGVPKKAKEHAKTIESAMDEVEYFHSMMP